MISTVRQGKVELTRLGSGGDRGDGGWCEADGRHRARRADSGGGVTDARGMTKRGFARRRAAVMPGGPSWRKRLLASQRTFAGDVLRATTPMPPARAAPAPARAAARPGRPHLPGGPRPPPAIGPAARGEPIAVRPRPADHPEQRAKSTESRSDGERYLEHAGAMPGRLHPQPAQARPPVLRQLAETTFSVQCLPEPARAGPAPAIGARAQAALRSAERVRRDAACPGGPRPLGLLRDGPRRPTVPPHRRWNLPSAPTSAWPTSRRPR